jgi:UDP-glucose-4-epimerase GalE
MMKSILVVGGAGYIGSHMVKILGAAGYDVTTLDNLSTGHRDAVLSGDFIEGDLLNPDDLDRIFNNQQFDVVMHFAAFCYVGDSVNEPLKYYKNNVTGTVNLLDAMKAVGTDKFVFSSSCATYGVPDKIPITEDETQNPVNPYGQTKLMVERILKDSASAYKMNSIALRYFNVAGCDLGGQLGERHDPETHLIPLVLLEAQRVLKGGSPEDTMLRVFGDDFDTPDGTCIRDYIHVQDLCTAHMSAMEYLLKGKADGFESFNLGNGQGHSVKEVIDTCREVTGINIAYRIVDRRSGDPPRLVGCAEKAKSVLEWTQQYCELDTIIETAWQYFKKDTGNIS